MQTCGDKYLVIGTRNVNKVKLIQACLQPYDLKFIMAADLSIPDPIESGTTFKANATIKARAYSMTTNMPALADDSGLCIPALHDFPGVRTAEYVASQGGPAGAIMDLQQRLTGLDHHAFFTTCLVLCVPKQDPYVIHTKVDGMLIFDPSIPVSWGLTSIFQPSGADCVFSQMNDSEQQRYSHRSLAIQKFIEMHLDKVKNYFNHTT